jgi:uncharacterized damage-inducible protein DinB
MNQPILTAEDVMAWNEKTSQGWRKLVAEHPEMLALPCDIAGTKVVGALLQHIVAVELRYAEQLAGLPVSEYADIPYDSAESLYATHDRAAALYRQLFESNIDWNQPFEYVTRSYGAARSSRKTIFFHAHLHAIRHYAQLATLVRQHGIKPDWQMDYLMMDFERA